MPEISERNLTSRADQTRTADEKAIEVDLIAFLICCK